MPNKISVSIYPNKEIRAIVGRERASRSIRDSGLEDSGADDGCSPGVADGPPLDITSKLSASLRPGFGGLPRPTKFGNNARRTISRCAGVFEADGHHPGEFVLLTGTIPGSTRLAFEAVARWSSWIVKAVKTWISSKFIESAYSIYVWEFQKRGALHIHYCLHVPDMEQRTQVLNEWKKKWTGIIDSVSAMSGVDVWERRNGGTWATNKGVIQADAQVIKKSVGAYLSKYLSKNAPTNSVKPWQTQRFYGPVRWWGCSRPLLKRCQELTERFEIEAIAHKEVRALENLTEEIMNASENKVYSYRDKAGSTRVLLTYSPEAAQNIFSYLKREILWRRKEVLSGCDSSWVVDYYGIYSMHCRNNTGILLSA